MFANPTIDEQAVSGDLYKNRLAALRAEFGALKIDGFLVPRADQYPGEFVSPPAERLAWLTGFTGSAGTAVVLKDKAAVFTDGRYTLQLAQQADKSLYEFEDVAKTKIGEWIAQQAKPGKIIGFDPWLYTPEQIETLEKRLTPASIVLKAIEINPLKPIEISSNINRAEIFPAEVAGLSSLEKKKSAGEVIDKTGALAFIMALPDSIAWILNIRGHDVEHTPVVLSHAILFADGGFVWFVEPGKITDEVRKHLGADVQVVPPHLKEKMIGELGAEAKSQGKPVVIDFSRTPLWFKTALEKEGASVLNLKDPCILPKAMKTPAEQQAIREAHIKDGVALTRFLVWFDRESSRGRLTELDVVHRLEEFRKRDSAYREPSFSTIAGWNANGAIVHYRANEASNQTIKGSGLMLLDSGGQYEWGTTDVTRTILVGSPTPEMKSHFTAVLKGHIALASTRFPPGTLGTQLDAIARQKLWREGLDYSHGTGHGVGCYLAVHEEAANISPRGKEPLQPGMLLSNEPGYYRAGVYGIRTESLVFVHRDEDMLAFETVTLAPIDKRLIEVEKLSATEREWLNAYHARVAKILSPLVEKDVKAWLEEAAAPL